MLDPEDREGSRDSCFSPRGRDERAEETRATRWPSLPRSGSAAAHPRVGTKASPPEHTQTPPPRSVWFLCDRRSACRFPPRCHVPDLVGRGSLSRLRARRVAVGMGSRAHRGRACRAVRGLWPSSPCRPQPEAGLLWDSIPKQQWKSFAPT